MTVPEATGPKGLIPSSRRPAHPVLIRHEHNPLLRVISNLAAPGGRQRIGVALRKHQDDGVHTYRIPALATTAKGTVLCVYDMRRRMGRDLQEDIDIGLSRSAGTGRTWEPVRVIMDMGKYGGLPEEQNGCSDPGIMVDLQTGEIFCFAVWMNGKPGKHQWNADGSEPGFEIGKSAQRQMFLPLDFSPVVPAFRNRASSRC